MIGEIRDYETAQIAIQASLTGHLVLATVHTNDAPSTVTRMIDMGVEPFLLSSSLIGVLAQRLVRKLCLALQARSTRAAAGTRSAAPQCAMTGYKGRTGVYELMVVDDEIRALIHGRAAEAQIFAAAEAAGLRSMREDGERLVAEGITSRRRSRCASRATECAARLPCLMPAYKFEALDAAGKAHERPARRRQRARRALAAARAGAGAAGGHAGRLGRHRRRAACSFTRRVFNATGLAVWTRQLAGLVGSGLPLERALTALADEAEDTRQRELVAHLRSEVNAGSPFARALASAPREFDDVYRGVVAAGEQSGALGIVLERLADDLEARQELKGQADRRDALSGDRLGDRGRHRHLPRHLRRAAGGDRCSPAPSARCRC